PSSGVLSIPEMPVHRLPPILSEGPSVGGMLRALGRRWPLALGLGGLLAAVVGAALWFAVPAKYVAELGIEVRRPPREVFQNWEQLGEPIVYQRTQAQMIKSPLVLGAALKDAKVAELPGVRAHGDTAA